MSALTRRSDPEAHQEVWHAYYGDVRVGTIGEQAGVPIGVDQWGLVMWFLSNGRSSSGYFQKCVHKGTDGGVRA
jgi:hypothetical protein